jgi:hypothetical protein
MSAGAITMQLGQEMFTKVRNDSGYETISNGQAVYISGRNGVFPTVRKARSDSESTSRVLGIATQDLISPSFGFVTTMGYVRGIKTDYTGAGIWGTTWVTGDLLYISSTNAGILTNVQPTVPNHSDIVGSVGVVSTAQGSILVTLDRHRTVAELADVDGTDPTVTGSLLTWNQTDLRWERNSYNITNYALLTQAILKTPTAIESNLITIPNATYKGLVIKGAVSQSANSQEWQNSSGTVLVSVAGTGKLTINTGLETQHLQLGSSAAVAIFAIDKTYTTTTTGTVYGTFGNTRTNWNATASANVYGYQSQVVLGNTNGADKTTGDVAGFYAQVTHNGRATQPALKAGQFVVRVGYPNPNGFATNILTNGYGNYIFTPFVDTASGSSMVNSYGIYIENQNVASTLNYAIYTNAGAVRLGDTTTTTGRKRAVVTKTANYTSTTNDEIIRFTTSATLTLIAATGTGQTYTVIADGCTVIIDGNASETINNELTQTITDGESVILHDTATGKWNVG